MSSGLAELPRLGPEVDAAFLFTCIVASRPQAGYNGPMDVHDRVPPQVVLRVRYNPLSFG